MQNFILRIIRPADKTAEFEYIKAFFRFIGYLVTDYAVDDTISANWSRALVPEEKTACIDLVMNCPSDPYMDHCRQMGIRRIYCHFDLEQLRGEITPEPGLTAMKSGFNRMMVRHLFLRDLIEKIWECQPKEIKEILAISDAYLKNSHGDLFFVLQAKRSLRVLNMGELLREQSARVTKIPLLPYVKASIGALWEVYCRLETAEGIHGRYVRANVANKIYEIISKLYDTERAGIADIAYDQKSCLPPRRGELLRDLVQLVCENPTFVSAYLLMANIYGALPWGNEAEEKCYGDIWNAVSCNSRDYAFIWYRYGYFYEKRKRNLRKALEYYRFAVKLDPNCYQAWFKLGYYAAVDNNFPQAEALLRQMIRVIFHGRSVDVDESGAYTNWLTLSPKESRYIYRAYILLAKIALNGDYEQAIREYIRRACMAAIRFEEAAAVRQISNLDGNGIPCEDSFQAFLNYHQYGTPVWGMWQALYPWTERIIQDVYLRNTVRSHLSRWSLQ